MCASHLIPPPSHRAACAQLAPASSRRERRAEPRRRVQAASCGEQGRRQSVSRGRLSLPLRDRSDSRPRPALPGVGRRRRLGEWRVCHRLPYSSVGSTRSLIRGLGEPWRQPGLRETAKVPGSTTAVDCARLGDSRPLGAMTRLARFRARLPHRFGGESRSLPSPSLPPQA